MTHTEAIRTRAEQLIKQWRHEHATPYMNRCGDRTLSQCADELEALLVSLSEPTWQQSSSAPKDGWVVEGFRIGIPSGYHYRITRVDDPLTFPPLADEGSPTDGTARKSQ